MWICLNDAFFSLVSKDCARDELMVRARRPGDIEKLFPEAVVTEFTASDYHYRAAIKKDAIKAAMCGEIDRVVYSNFKSSVDDRPLHDAYLRVWTAMSSLQPRAPYSGRTRRGFFDFGDVNDPIFSRKCLRCDGDGSINEHCNSPDIPCPDCSGWGYRDGSSNPPAVDTEAARAMLDHLKPKAKKKRPVKNTKGR